MSIGALLPIFLDEWFFEDNTEIDQDSSRDNTIAQVAQNTLANPPQINTTIPAHITKNEDDDEFALMFLLLQLGFFKGISKAWGY